MPTPRRVTNNVARLLAESLAGQVSRRDIIRRATALGLSAPLVRMMLSAHPAGAQGTPTATDIGVTAPDWLRTDLAGAEITAVLGNGPEVELWELPAIAIFQEATGIVVNHVAGAEQTNERLEQYLQAFAAGSSDLDTMQIDVIDIGTVGFHAVDLSEALAQLQDQGATYFDRIVQNNTLDGQLVGIPWFTDAGLLYYRTDLLEKYGFETPPVSWAELEEQATTIMEGERADNPDFYGFVFQGAAYEGLTCDGLEWQVSNGGGTIIDNEGNVTLNNEQATAIFERAAGWVNGIAPEGVTAYAEEEARGVWQAGNAAFMRNWPYAYALGQEDGSPIAGMFDVTALPMGSGPDATHAATLGGWQMMVSQYSENTEAAIEFVKFVASPEAQKSRAIVLSLLPTIEELYADPDVLEANPFFERLLDVFTGAAVARPSTAAGEFYPQVSNAYYTSLNSILSGEAEGAATVEEMAQEIEDIMANL